MGIPHVDDWRVVKTLTWPWWSLEDLLLQLLLLIMATLPFVGVFVVTPQWKEGLNSKCPEPSVMEDESFSFYVVKMRRMKL